jgi:uncharacterized repeat protein (TIGR03803 family)
LEDIIMIVSKKIVLAFVFTSAVLSDDRLKAAVIYSYVAVPSVVTLSVGGKANVEIDLEEQLTNSSTSLLVTDGGVFNAGVALTKLAGTSAIITSGSNDSSFGGPSTRNVESAAASFLEGVSITALTGPEGTANGNIRLIPLASISITASSLGQTTFDIGEYNSLGGNTLDFEGNDLDSDSASPPYSGASDRATILTVYVPEPASVIKLLGAMGTLFGTRFRRNRSDNHRKSLECIQSLERRLFLTALPLENMPPHAASPTFVEMGLIPISQNQSALSASNLAAPFTASQIRQAYDVNGISFFGNSGDGTGQTIAIVDAYNDPNILFDANYFSQAMGLQQFNVNGGPSLTVVNQYGQNALPDNASPGTWDVEESIDVEWAHAIAPKANIVLFEANSSDLDDLMQAVDSARNYAGVDVVNMSWGGSEFEGEQAFDGYFTTPAGHQGVTFLGSLGNQGGSPQFPETSPNVIGVGATSLTINSNGSYGSESAWPDSGGGVSYYQPQPSYQMGKVNGISSTNRTSPDVSMVGDPATGVYVLDTFYNDNSFLQIGGTSLASPMWAGLVAIADQARLLMNQSSLDGATQTLPTLYQLPATDFHDVTAGSNGFTAGPGYDLASGLGTPAANQLVDALAGYQPASHVAFASSAITSMTAGASLPQIVVDVEDANGNTVTADHSQVTLTISGPNGAVSSATKTVTAQNGVGTFSNISLTQAGNYYLTATDGTLSRAVSGSFTVIPAAASKLIFVQQPTDMYVTGTLSPPPIVAVEDTYNNLVTSNTSTVSLSVNSGHGSITGISGVPASAGEAVFAGLSFQTPGNYVLKASDGNLQPAIASTFSVTGDKLAFTQEPGNNVINTTLAPIQVSIQSPTGGIATGDTDGITIAIDAGPAGGVLNGTTTVTAVNGVVTFSNISLSKPGSYILMAYSPNILTGTASSVTITDASTQVAFTPEPTGAIAGVPAYPDVVVGVEDDSSEIVPTDNSTVTLTIASGPSGAYLAGKTSVQVVNGVATFPDLIFSTPGTYTLEASDGNLASVVSTPISVSIGDFQLQPLAYLSGDDPIGNLISDSAGNLFGVTDGAVNSYQTAVGTIFEIPAGTPSVIALASFASSGQTLPSGNLAIDAEGDLFGTTEFGGSEKYGSIFELAKGSTTIQTVASFEMSNGGYPVSGLIIDPAGNLYGTTYSGGDYDAGVVFELPANSTNIQVLASIGGLSGGSNPFGGLYRDSNGDLFGTTEYGGDFNAGTVFELAADGSFKTIISLAGPDGEDPTGTLIGDSNGNLYGTTYQGGADGDGTVFEVSGGHLTTLLNFTGGNGQTPFAGLVIDGNGNLFGTALEVRGDQNGNGIIYEISHDGGGVTMLADFSAGVGEWPYGGLTFGADGNLYGIAAGGGSYEGGSVYELHVPSLTPSISVNNGAKQRSMDNVVTVSFPDAVTLGADAFTLSQQSNGGLAIPMNFNLNTTDGGLTWNITFPSYAGGSLPDGTYDLTINASSVISIVTNMSMPGGNQTFSFYRLFGDADGNGTVDQSDYTAFLNSYGQTSGSQLYNPIFDYDANGIVNGLDYLQFKKRFGTSTQT